MANVIKIKRGSSANLDSLTLQEGELATTTDTRKLYIGNADGTKTELGQQGPQGVRGTKWWVGDFYSQMFDNANNGDLLLNTSEMSPGEVLQFYDGMWDPVANIRGPQGPQGEKGEPGESIPVGSIIPYGNSVVPETYLLCNGQAVSRTDYPELFAIIGTSFGSGDGSTTFNVPDYRDKFVLGAGGDVDLAETGGEKEHILNLSEIPKHHHQCSGAGNTALKNGAYTLMSDVNGQNPRPAFYTGWEGGGQPHNNMPPYVGTYYIIKAKQSVGVIATVVDNLSSTSPTDALSANQGKILNDKFNDMLPVVLYETDKTFSAVADNTVITLNDNLSNYKRIIFYGISNNKNLGSVEVYNPTINDQPGMFIAANGSRSGMYAFNGTFRQWLITSKNKITYKEATDISSKLVEGTALTGFVQDTTNIKIYRIIGFKY